MIRCTTACDKENSKPNYTVGWKLVKRPSWEQIFTYVTKAEAIFTVMCLLGEWGGGGERESGLLFTAVDLERNQQTEKPKIKSHNVIKI